MVNGIDIDLDIDGARNAIQYDQGLKAGVGIEWIHKKKHKP